MKKILIILCSMILSCSVSAAEFQNGREYTTKNQIIHNAPEIIEFFSFFCPHCYEFEKRYNKQYITQNNFKKKIPIRKYHVNFLGGPLSLILTKSWIIAQQIGIQQKIILPIFKGIQETNTIHDINDIKKIFTKEAGITEMQFNALWNSFTLRILEKKINHEIIQSNLDRIPVMLVKGKYMIDYAELEEIFQERFYEKYIELINFLINKK